ncbi:MAG: DUF1464 family protein [Candidatus Omnitrophota bacterium]|jgi:predicted butyrate kinase (DUF1464 family)
MRIVGIDPGTGSFDFFGMDGDRIIIDASVAVPDVARNPRVLLETLRSLLPLDMIVGPSGYGLPVTSIEDMTERELNLMVPDDKSIPLYDGIRMVLRSMKTECFPVWFTPGVIHLPTLPVYRKANKIDMGTADKVCCVAVAMRDQVERTGIEYNQTSFILVEMGYAFTAVIAIENGSIVDALGGTSGGPGFMTLGSMDAELAVRMGKFPGIVLFSGGAKDMSGKTDLTPQELVKERVAYSDAWNMLLESAVKGVAAMTAVVERPREILISGRLTELPEITEELKSRLSRYGTVRKVKRHTKVAKEAAEGAYIIGEGLSGGKYSALVESLALKQASGTMYDYILVKGVDISR